MAADTLTLRQLNRATLARQLLLERDTERTAAEAIEHLVGMQAQAPDAPYVGLWTRLAGFRTGELVDLISQREAVRIHVMRATVHLVIARDARRLRPTTAIVLERSFRGQPFAKALAGVDLDEVVAAARALLDEQPLSRADFRTALAERWPDHDPDGLAYAAIYLLPMVQIPPRGLWQCKGQPVWATAEAWLGGPLGPPLPRDELLVRYLGAFGPASVMDAQTWSGLTKLREVADDLLKSGQLRPFRDEDGRERLDLPDAPRPDEDTPAPVRFLPEYDNLLLSHADRRRVNPLGRRVPLPPGYGGTGGMVLVDGVYRADWSIKAGDLTIAPFVEGGPLSETEQTALDEEGRALVDFVDRQGPAPN
jgi:hypothetical protein